MKTTNGSRYRTFVVTAFVLSLVMLVANPIPSAFAELNLHFSTPNPTRFITARPIIKLVCTKGKRIEYVTGITPKCPEGYKKLPTPVRKPLPKPTSVLVTPTPTSTSTSTSTSTPTPTPTVVGIPTDSSGTYTGNVNFPNLDTPGITGCEAQVLQKTIIIQEASGGKITGSVSPGPISGPISGTKVGNTIIATITTNWGPRGPYSWQLNGNTLTGSMAALCNGNGNAAPLTAEGMESFSMTRP